MAASREQFYMEEMEDEYYDDYDQYYDTVMLEEDDEDDFSIHVHYYTRLNVLDSLFVDVSTLIDDDYEDEEDYLSVYDSEDEGDDNESVVEYEVSRK